MIPESAISPDLLAAKLAHAENLERPDLAKRLETDPGLVELLWFIQWRSFQPGGLNQFVADLIATCPDRFITSAMRAAGPPHKERYTLAQCWPIWRQSWDGRGWTAADAKQYQMTTWPWPTGLNDFTTWLALHFDPDLTLEQIERGRNCDKQAILQGVEHFNWPFLKAHCLARAEADLPSYLRDLCAEKSTPLDGPTYCPDLLSLIADYMSRHADTAGLRLAETEVTRKVFDGLEYAHSERKFIRIEGNARFGKAESVKTWCLRYPGRARLVTVPCSNRDSDLIRAVADALGMIVSPGAGSYALREKVEFIIRHGRLGWVFDESHFLFPTRYGPHTTPTRLNWLRQQIVDLGLPCVLVATPQAYEGQRARFDRATRYNMEQWTGRISRRIQLPNELEESELLAVAKLHFPAFPDAGLRIAVGAALKSNSYLKAIEDVATLAQWKARQRHSNAVKTCDLEAAILEAIPGAGDILGRPRLAPAVQSEQPARRPRPRRKSAAETVRELLPGASRQADFSPDSAPRSGAIPASSVAVD